MHRAKGDRFVRANELPVRQCIMVCLFQSYKNMWNNRTDAKGKRLSKVVASKTRYSQFHDNV